MLTGKRIVVTRARAQAGKLAELLEALGSEVIEFPTIEIVPGDTSVDAATLNDFDWVVFTSANGVKYFAEALEGTGRPFDFGDAKVCAVGPATREALESRGVNVDLVPDEYIAEGVLAALNSDAEFAGKHFLLPRGDLARDYLPEKLRESGAETTELVVYRTVCPEVSDAAKDDFVASKPDVVTFTSASTARHYVELLGEARLEVLGNIVYASIGPQTTEAAEAAGLKVTIEPARHDVEGLVEALAGIEF